MNIPSYIVEFLNNKPDSAAAFEKLPPSHQKEYVRWIEEAKKQETKLRRMEKMVGMLMEKCK